MCGITSPLQYYGSSYNLLLTPPITTHEPPSSDLSGCSVLEYLAAQSTDQVINCLSSDLVG